VEADLAKKGEAERTKTTQWYEEKARKEADKAAKAAKKLSTKVEKGQTSLAGMFAPKAATSKSSTAKANGKKNGVERSRSSSLSSVGSDASDAD
jgi:hypothetical protein